MIFKSPLICDYSQQPPSAPYLVEELPHLHHHIISVKISIKKYILRITSQEWETYKKRGLSMNFLVWQREMRKPKYISPHVSFYGYQMTLLHLRKTCVRSERGINVMNHSKFPTNVMETYATWKQNVKIA